MAQPANRLDDAVPAVRPESPQTRRSSAGFASGLILYGGGRKPGYNAYRMPVFLPVTSTRRGRSLEVWGCVRPAHFASLDAGGTPQQVRIQFQPGSRGAFTTLRTVTITSPRGYFDLRPVVPRQRHREAGVVVSGERPAADSQPDDAGRPGHHLQPIGEGDGGCRCTGSRGGIAALLLGSVVLGGGGDPHSGGGGARIVEPVSVIEDDTHLQADPAGTLDADARARGRDRPRVDALADDRPCPELGARTAQLRRVGPGGVSGRRTGKSGTRS